MSTRLTSNTEELTLTRFAGSEETMLLLSRARTREENPSDRFFDTLRLTREEARSLAEDLMDFANNEETPLR
jgi:hypothetical protein